MFRIINACIACECAPCTTSNIRRSPEKKGIHLGETRHRAGTLAGKRCVERVRMTLSDRELTIDDGQQGRVLCG
jgi:hypothetical protein